MLNCITEEDSDNEEIFLSQRRKKRKTEPVSKSGDPGVEFVAAEPEKTTSPDIVFEKKVGKNESMSQQIYISAKQSSLSSCLNILCILFLAQTLKWLHYSHEKQIIRLVNSSCKVVFLIKSNGFLSLSTGTYFFAHVLFTF